jgi:hypothetical protein
LHTYKNPEYLNNYLINFKPMKSNNAYPSKLTRLKDRLNSFKLSPKAIFIIMGVATTLWFLMRVIPKPQRAGYPCMRAAAPIMSGFVVYLLALGGSVLFFKKAFSKIKQGHYLAALSAFVCCAVLLVFFNVKDAKDLFSSPKDIAWEKGVLPDGVNNPMGTGFGIFPGRVAWVRNPASTNDNCKNTMSDAYFMAKNNNQAAINSMADKAILSVGGQATVKDSWDAIFKSFNKKKTGVETGYTAGQTIFIKVNNGQAGWAIRMSDLSETGTFSSTGVQNAAMANTTPAAVLAFVRQLVDSCGIPQDKIYIGEPMTHLYKSLYDAIHPYYPDVKLIDKENHVSLGRTTTSGWTNNAIIYSDKGAEMPDAISDALMNEMYNADYLIPVAALKAHARGGVSLCAKLHFGSHGNHNPGGYGSFHLHDGLICTVDNDIMTSGVRGDYNMYRVLTDLMGHEKLGRNSVLFIVDGLWAGIEATDMAVKWKTAPFNNDWPSSLFVSQDEVAVESVCIDFLRAEANINTAFKNRPFFPAVDDYLHQAADQANWPVGITYDPEGDGTAMPASLGVHEHWNNDTDKKYTKNLAVDGKGIEMVEILDTVTVSPNVGIALKNISVQGIAAYPNPCTSSTEISYYLKNNATIEYSIVSMDGKVIYTLRKAGLGVGKQTQELNTENLSSGIYMVVLKSVTAKSTELSTVRVIVK